MGGLEKIKQREEGRERDQGNALGAAKNASIYFKALFRHRKRGGDGLRERRR